MSKYYDMIATVDIDIKSPIVDDASFDNLLIVGPLPKVAPEKAPPKVGAYSSIDEVIAAGWVSSGDSADPVGVAATVAFAQSPTPSTIYIAAIQHTAAAVQAAEDESEIAEIAAENIGTNSELAGCTIQKDTGKRVIAVNLTEAMSKVKNTGFFVALNALIAAGYAVKVDGRTITDVNSFRETEDYAALAAMTKGGDPVQMLVSLTKDGTEIEYGIVVGYPGANQTEYTTESYDKTPISAPEAEVESATAALQRAIGTSGWYVACPAGVDPKEYEDMAAYIEAQEKMMVYTELGFFGEEENKATVGSVYFRTGWIYGRETTDQADDEIPAANHYMNVAFVAKWLNYPSGSETTAFKALGAVYPSKLTTTEMKAIEEANGNYFITVGSKNITMNGKVAAGEWADIIRFRDWQKNDMQLRVVNLFVMNSKVPYTDPGIALVQNQMMASLKAGQDAGGIAPEEFDEDGNSIPGYQTSVPLAASLSAAEKASRKLRKCKFKARLAGAIHFAELKGSLTYEL